MLNQMVVDLVQLVDIPHVIKERKYSMKKVYISGPVTGHDGWRENFRTAEEALKLKGYDVINPMKLNDIYNLSDAEYEDCLTLDLSLLNICDTIYMLNGWQESKGANREYGFALGREYEIMFEELD